METGWGWVGMGVLVDVETNRQLGKLVGGGAGAGWRLVCVYVCVRV